MAEVKLASLIKKFGDVTAVAGMNLDVQDGEFITLVGPSGCGKTTTLRMVAGLEEPTAGEIYIGDRLANYIPAKDRGIAMVFQSYALFPHMSVAANIAFGLKMKKTPREERQKGIAWALELLDLQGLGERRPRELSGGQRQRVALGRALVLNPEVLLLDEPLSNLDAKLRLRMRTELKRIHRKVKSTTIYVTHDQVEAMTLSDRVVVMKDGFLMQVGTPDEVYNYPANMFVAGFIGSPTMNFIPCKLTERNGKLFVDVEDFAIEIPEKLADKVRTHSGSKGELILGVRPEGIRDKALIKDAPPENTIKAMIDVIEPVGSELILTFTTGKHEFQAVVSPDTKATIGQKMEMIIDTDKVHLFAEETETAII